MKYLIDWYYILIGAITHEETVSFWERRQEAKCRWGFHDRNMFSYKCENFKCKK